MHKWADISGDGRFRYELGRVWNPYQSRVMFVLLNPSTADAEKDDPTVRRCISFAQHWNYGSLVIANLMAVRNKNPLTHLEYNLDFVKDIVGPENDRKIEEMTDRVDLIVMAWGLNPTFGRDKIVSDMLSKTYKRSGFIYREQVKRPLYCFSLTKDGHPRHPLYLHRDTNLVPFEV